MATPANTASGSLMSSAASAPLARPEIASAPTCMAWLFPIARPCSLRAPAEPIRQGADNGGAEELARRIRRKQDAEDQSAQG